MNLVRGQFAWRFEADRHEQPREIPLPSTDCAPITQHFEKRLLESPQKIRADIRRPAKCRPQGGRLLRTRRIEPRNEVLPNPVGVDRKQVIQPRRQHHAAKLPIGIHADRIEVATHGRRHDAPRGSSRTLEVHSLLYARHLNATAVPARTLFSFPDTRSRRHRPRLFRTTCTVPQFASIGRLRGSKGHARRVWLTSCAGRRRRREHR